ncbi:MAG: class I SAM-dependent methyltransferase [Kiritimatiellaeota bacterium]|nr:class I SAM-dependent methyltransferase [Kiritimatiellota bacterium]
MLKKSVDQDFENKKWEKLERVRDVLRKDMHGELSDLNFNFLSAELRCKYNIVDTENVSSNNYDPIAVSLIEKYPDGLILDCGAGKRSMYYSNVVNFEIVPYDTTDVLSVGEELPFQDNVFDAVFSLAVLEHVKDPFKCASEIARVMKPGATLYCVVPFLQPVHGYPHHYYNMSMQGLKNLFADFLQIHEQTVPASGLPIWALTWMLNSWASGLPSNVRDKFLNMKVSDLLGNPLDYLNDDFVKALSSEKNSELACTTALIGRKS